MDGILDGTITHADPAGGVEKGLLLWYASVTTNDNENREYALAYLKKLAKRARIKNYPGSIARYELGECAFPAVLKDAAGSEDLQTCLGVANRDLFKRRQLCKALIHDQGMAGVTRPDHDLVFQQARPVCRKSGTDAPRADSSAAQKDDRTQPGTVLVTRDRSILCPGAYLSNFLRHHNR